MNLQKGDDGNIGAEIIRNCKEFQQISREDFKKSIN